MNKRTSNEIDEDVDMDNSTSEINVDQFRVRHYSMSMSVRQVSDMRSSNRLTIPELQRGYVWDEKTASRLIESILMGIPIPALFVFNDENDKSEIIDGLQRITTIECFINEKPLPNVKKKNFKLDRSINKKWRDKGFKDLNASEQNRIEETSLTITYFEQKSPIGNQLSKVYVFERLNTGGKKLTPQEIRNAVYQGIFRESLKHALNKWNFRDKEIDVEGPKASKYEELILRTLTIYSIVKNDYKKLSIDEEQFRRVQDQKINLKDQMDYFMDYYSKDNVPEIDLFNKSIELLYNLKGDPKLFMSKNLKSNRINPVMFETIISVVMRLIEMNLTIIDGELLMQRYQTLIINDVEMEPFNLRTTNIDSIKKRQEILFQILT